MCGGFVTAYTLKINQNTPNQSPSILERFTPHLLYNIGRVFTYTVLGAVFGLIGETLGVIAKLHQFQAILQVVAGALMFLIALEMANWLPSGFSGKFPGYPQFKKLAGILFKRVNKRNILGLGAVLGLIPCGLVYAAGAKAASTGNITAGMLTMLFFGLGTFPALFAVGLGANAVSVNFRSRVFKIATILVLILGVITIYRGTVMVAQPPALHQHSAHQTAH